MAIENLEHSKNSLEHVKFTSDSNDDNSIVQTFDTNQTPQNIKHVEIMCVLKEIKDELKKLNTHMNIINESDL